MDFARALVRSGGFGSTPSALLSLFCDRPKRDVVVPMCRCAAPPTTAGREGQRDQISIYLRRYRCIRNAPVSCASAIVSKTSFGRAVDLFPPTLLTKGFSWCVTNRGFCVRAHSSSCCVALGTPFTSSGLAHASRYFSPTHNGCKDLSINAVRPPVMQIFYSRFLFY